MSHAISHNSATPITVLWRTAFGFRSIWQWPTAIQRATFFLIASVAEYLAATRLIGWLVRGLSASASVFLFLLTPQAAADLEGEPRRDMLRTIIIATVISAIVISLVGNGIFTWLAGTFSGDDTRRYYFIEDTHNLVMYAVVAPAYLAAAAAIIYCAFSTFTLEERAARSSSWPENLAKIIRLGTVISSIVLISGLVQVNYFQDNIMGLASQAPDRIEPNCANRLYWFVDQITASDTGRHLTLNSAGVYYICMQFIHMAIVTAALLCILTAMYNLYRLAGRLSPDFLLAHGGTDPVRKKLARFSLLEVSAKWLALILTVHIYIWGDSCLRGHENIRVTAMFLLALQFFILATPRLLIEYRLLRVAALERGSGDSTIEWPDLIDQRDRLKCTGISSLHFVVQLALAVMITKLIDVAIG